MKLAIKSLVLSLILVVSACAALSSKEVTRIPISTVSTEEQLDWKSTSLDLKKGDKLWLWTDIDIEYEGDLGLEYQVKVYRDKDTLGMVRLNPLDCKVKMMEVSTTLMNKSTRSYQGNMDVMEIKQSGNYRFEAILVSNGNQSLQLKKADLVLKK
jgi:hypothetical protein